MTVEHVEAEASNMMQTHDITKKLAGQYDSSTDQDYRNDQPDILIDYYKPARKEIERAI